ncbi:MAG: DUF192 domain-containing protein [Pseudomonadota bacterium]
MRALALALVFGIALPLSGAGGGDHGGSCSADTVDVVTGDASATYRVEIADEPAERSRGLMFRQSLDRDAGMLFLFDEPAPASFWMRNTFISLDIIFVDETGTVLNVAENTVPFSEAPIPSDGDAAAVLEVNAGEAAEHGIAAGTRLRHPAFAAHPDALPCP